MSCRGSSCLRGCKWPSIVVEDVVEEIVHGLEHGQGGGHPGHPVVDIEVAGWAALQEQVLLHLQEAGHGVSGVKPLGHSLERVAVPLIAGIESGLHGLEKFIGFGIDEAAQLVEHRPVGAPDAAAQDDVARLEVHVVARQLGVAPALAQHAREVILVGRLVVAEPHVAVDAVHAVFHIQAAHLVVDLCHELDEALHVVFPGLPQGVVLSLVLHEPRAVVVGLQLAQESQYFGDVAIRFHVAKLLQVERNAKSKARLLNFDIAETQRN